jgi:cellulose synthase/poly-beta-1,6-N-acetylglucosamine synthase-like glycosyltransferase
VSVLSVSFTVAVLVAMFVVTQLLYLFALIHDLYMLARPVDWVELDDAETEAAAPRPRIVLLYPVLREPEATMRTTFVGLATLDYPADRYRIVAVPNHDDEDTIAALERLQLDFPFLEVLEVPPTSDPSWEPVWQSWEETEKAYWWHTGGTARNRNLPPKKTRQLVYALYTIHGEETEDDWLLNYIDADSVPPRDHLRAGAAGAARYDVVQSTNVAGNLLDTWPASWHAMDHMAWDGMRYPHLSAHGRHPYWVLGKGLFYHAPDLIHLGSFNPWVTIEDPEVGMRLWVNGRHLGIIASPLIEEVPLTLRHGLTQRKRWICGFYQALGRPLRLMGMRRRDRFRAWTNFLPCLSLGVNPIGIPVGVWALVEWLRGTSPLPVALTVLAIATIVLYCISMGITYASTWRRTAIVLDRRRDRVRYMLRVNPVFLWIYWLWWSVPIWVGTVMYLRDGGKVWERTEKVDAIHELVREVVKRGE